MSKITSRRPSLQDVAKLAGVSSAAVSYVVNGRTGEVGAKTRAEIETAIKALNYRPHRRGLSLKFNREFAIGFVVFDENPNFLADPFTTQVATGLSDALAGLGYGLTVAGCRSADHLQTLLSRPIGVDAFVVVASGPPALRHDVYAKLSETHLPIAIIQEPAPARIADACGIVQDDFGGAACLTRHLLDRGARRFLYVSPSCDWPAIERRRAGVESALRRRCTIADLRCDEHDFTDTVAQIETAIAAQPGLDAIMGANDQIAIAALKALGQAKLAVPGVIQVTGFNGFIFRDYVTPLLTTIHSNALQIGRACAQAILDRLDGAAFPTRLMELPVTIGRGGTTGVCRG